ncbi:hypothetical protein HK19_15965 [Acetobacter persici]|uniref:hypothetical protein n=1 Tax=Acetobacter persici TaxID=1076596 RepID=UPI000A3D24EA|nr:hypothetical protein [Acetobacter persici]OUI88318.1 hypothetical protein HK19_15965 [Acetobacter persici]
MKTHSATSTPAASACQPDTVRGEDLVDMALLSRIRDQALTGLSAQSVERIIAASRMLIMGHTFKSCSVSLGIKYGTLTGGIYASKIREIVYLYHAQKGGEKSLASLACDVDVPLVQRIGFKQLAKPNSMLGQNVLAIAALMLQGLPLQDIALMVGIKIQTIKKSYSGKAKRICTEYTGIKNPVQDAAVAERPIAFELLRLNGALIPEHEVSMSAVWRGMERWRGAV